QAEVYGLDLSAEMLEQAKQKEGAQAIRWILGDAQALPFPNRSFDCTFICLALHHIEDKARAIEEMYRVLKPGGRSLIWTVSHHQIRAFPLNEFFLSLAKIDLSRFPSIPQIQEWMERAGFTAVRRKEVLFEEEIPTADYIARVRNRYISTLDLLGEEEFALGLKRLERSLPRRYGPRMIRRPRFTIVTGRR
ncbi:TPA: methyltransferase domain-containing protein, partial [Candidatus Bipolaricaulota bacterium]|nr:methyltransferase domain-containing protein [Candidatus Bipolaricaulota bacterium]